MQIYPFPAARSSEFKCFWGSFHVKPASVVIGVLEIILTIFWFVRILQQDLDSTSKFRETAYFIIAISVFIFLLIGIKKENSEFLLPYLIYKV